MDPAIQALRDLYYYKLGLEQRGKANARKRKKKREEIQSRGTGRKDFKNTKRKPKRRGRSCHTLEGERTSSRN